MKRRAKLTEKKERVANGRKLDWGKAIPKYLDDVERLNKEQARSHRFAMLLQQLLGVESNFIEEYCAGIEQFLTTKEKDRILKGRADNLFGNVVIEFETNIHKKRAEAESQLRRYVATLWSSEPKDARTPYLCIGTDGVRFLTYSPLSNRISADSISPEEISLQLLEEADWTKLEPQEIFFWLDRYLLRKEIQHPTSEVVVNDFGLKSHAFQTTANILLEMWRQVKTQSDFAVIFDSWDKYLRIVYGSRVAGDELFIRHTYLATLAKLMSWFRITESKSLPDDSHIVEMLEGQLFRQQGIENFIEEDFFAWLTRPEVTKAGIGVVRFLFSLLQNYRLRELSEDVLKSLYQELVDPETRHDLGEFYTPDWLAHRMVNKLLDTNPKGYVLDPACGSGTFLYLTIREKIDRLGHSIQTLTHILDSVYGADVHPLAVIVAKTNYILALGDLLKNRKGVMTIPIYLADTLKLPEMVMETAMIEINGTLIQQLPGYRVELNGQEVRLPERLVENISLYDKSIELAKEFALQNKGKPITYESFRNYLLTQQFSEAKDQVLVHSIFSISEARKQFIDINRDTIWAFILKNIYKPLFLKRKFDFVIGNPPWISFRFIEPEYQKFLRRHITGFYKLLIGRGELITHMEIATLFLVRSADFYLKSGGSIGFVLPRSIFTADQHDGLRKRNFIFYEHPGQSLIWREIWDCEKVEPLFNVPASVLLADKLESKKMKYPAKGQILSGRLNLKNASLIEAQKKVAVQDVEYNLHTRGKRSFWAIGQGRGFEKASFYRNQFSQGAAIVPRSFWFVQIKPFPLGINPNLPLFETAERAKEKAKEAYNGVVLRDNVEAQFLYATLLSTDLLPFGHLDFRMVVLPIQPVVNHYRLLKVDEARQNGFLYLARWLEKVQKEWEKRRGSKAERLTSLEWLDYRGKLTLQDPKFKFRVIYNVSGTFLTAAIVESRPIRFKINGQIVKANGFLSECVTYYLDTSDQTEAYYLCAILNAPVIDDLIKPMQARGLWGPRHISKKVLELPIPQFQNKNKDHKRLAELGEECTQRVKKWLAGGGAGKIKSIGRLRGMVRGVLKDELEEIDKIVKKILE